MSDPIDFYFDFSSPYGYFGAERIDALAQELGREVRWHAILLGPMFKATGSSPTVQVPVKGAYARHDMLRTAELNGIAFRVPEPFPISTVACARIALYLEALDFSIARRFAKRALRAYYVDNVNIGEKSAALRLAGESGADSAEVAAAIESQPLKDRLRAANDAALARGVFGSPFVIVDDEPFWGFDRFDAMRTWMKRRASHADLSSIR